MMVHFRYVGVGLILFALCAFSVVATEEKSKQDKAKAKIPEPDANAAEVAKGYRVEVVLTGLTYPSCIEFDDQGAMFVAECGHMPGDDMKPARILKYAAGKNRAEQAEVIQAKLEAPITDLLWHKGKLYISHKSKISVLENGKVRDLVTDLPSHADHSNNQLAAGPDGMLYVGIGAATNSGVVGEDNFAMGWPKKHPEVCEVPAKDIILRGGEFESNDPRSKDKKAKIKTSAYHPFGKAAQAGTVVKGQTKANSAILRMNLDGSNLEVYAWGFRNPYGLIWGTDKQLYCADAGSDARGSRPIANSPEVLWLVKKDAFYGWPDFFAGKPVTDPVFAPKKGPAPQFLMQEHPPVEKPLMTFELHASVTQLALSRGGNFGFVGHLFLGASGDLAVVTAEEDVRSGYWVKRIDPKVNKAEVFFRTRPDALGPKGLEYVQTAGPKRLVGLRFSPSGDALYVVDIGANHFTDGTEGPVPVAYPNTGVVWKITRADVKAR